MTKKLKEMIHLAMGRISSKTSVLALLMMVFTMPAFAQDVVKGTVIDNNGEAVIGATVQQKEDKKNATITLPTSTETSPSNCRGLRAQSLCLTSA